ncbi:zinc-binding alcohol dehydrogenase family protein [Paenibacillus filicis]|uniref:Zinc-binding alcohol dehydrogenase family protein n=1 Tax=Paenibacillus gyeongsangnamensis TaxID=3388067 RepID=A0ABT4Q632_9BACL|nr:zinc-binding alcohol dehydrogenase family protein [Paenibacillus filicis]MCZ8512278.1 zinc-binding alcohol dehydrogenase family protein [Paenibacillus filicis]
MKTIYCEEPNRFELKETEMPRRTEREALVRIRRVGICGTDLHAYRGNQPYFVYPRVLGHELAGEIIEIGPNADGLQPGDQVTVIPYLECGECIACRSGRTNCCTQLSVLGVHQDGGMREFITVPATHLLRAEGLTLDQTAIVECLSIGAHAVRRAAVQPGEFALVIGAGPIGLGVMKYAQLAGAKVIALDINEERLAFCKSWAPADYTVNASHDPVGQIESITSGEFPTLVMDATGNARSMENAFRYVSHGGRLVFVGLVKADISFSDPEFHKREMTLLSSRNATRADFEQVIGSIRDGKVNTDAFITHRASFDEMIGTYEAWLKPETGVIKAIVEV